MINTGECTKLFIQKKVSGNGLLLEKHSPCTLLDIFLYKLTSYVLCYPILVQFYEIGSIFHSFYSYELIYIKVQLRFNRLSIIPYSMNVNGYFLILFIDI